MANRLEQNVIIIDSACGNVVLFGTSGMDTVAKAMLVGSSGTQTFRSYVITAAAVDLVSNTDATITIAGANSSNVMINLNKWNPRVSFNTPLRLSTIKPIVVTGTGFLYLG